jgi:ribosomal protein S18 acetylase RimI-like enzyme
LPIKALITWGPEQATELAALWAAAAPGEPLSLTELTDVVLADTGVVLATPDGAGAVAAVTRESPEGIRGHIKFIAVHPHAQRRGLGRHLLAAGEDWLTGEGARLVGLGAGAPLYFWPGVDAANLPAQSLALAAGYRVVGCDLNLRLPTSYHADTPEGVLVWRLGGSGDEDGHQVTALRQLVAREWPIWMTEFELGLTRGTLFGAFSHRRGAQPRALGFCAHSTLRRGWIGPLGTHPRYRQQGVGAALVSAVCGDLRGLGHVQAEVPWVGPIAYFADRGATLSRAFRRFSRLLDPPGRST